jgi:RimJ/RimL family protein N-acetyltransferase
VTALRLVGEECVALVQSVLEDAPAFFRMSHGDVARADEAERLFRELPPGGRVEDKRVWLVEVEGEAVGVVELARNWPNVDTAIIGLLLLRERAQRRGIATKALALLEDEMRAMGHARARIAVIEENAGALAFWRARGFIETGERKPHVIVFEKVLAAPS